MDSGCLVLFLLVGGALAWVLFSNYSCKCGAEHYAGQTFGTRAGNVGPSNLSLCADSPAPRVFGDCEVDETKGCLSCN